MAGFALAGCGQQPPSWDSLLAGKITGQYPDYRVSVTAPGQLRVERPGMPAQTVAVEPIAQHCLRGPGIAATRLSRCCLCCAIPDTLRLKYQHPKERCSFASVRSQAWGSMLATTLTFVLR